MSEPLSALRGAAREEIVRVEDAGLRGMITLRGDFALDAFRNPVTALAGVAFPEPRKAEIDGERGLLWMSPDEAMVLLPYEEAPVAAEKLRSDLAGQHALVADVSDARATFRLTGGPVRDVLAKLSPADLSAEALPAGELRRTRIAQIPAAFWIEAEDAATLIAFRSVAVYAFELLVRAADPASAVDFF